MRTRTKTPVEYAQSMNGVVTRSEVVVLGVPSSTLDRMVLDGLLDRPRPGIYTLPGLADDHLTMLHVACRKLGRPYRSVARTTGDNSRKNHDRPGCCDIRGPPRVNRGQWPRQRAAESKPTDTAPRRAWQERQARNGEDEDGSRAAHTRLRGPYSELERLLVYLMRKADLPEPDRQFRPDWLRPTRGRVDLAYPSDKLVIEGDSRRWHTLLNSFEIDRLRDNAAQLAGWRILRFTWAEITDHPERVASTIATALET